jgi:hypothetical protein
MSPIDSAAPARQTRSELVARQVKELEPWDREAGRQAEHCLDYV